MRTVPDCLVCILGDVFAAAQQVADAQTALRVARAAGDYLSREFDYTLPPSYHITAVHRILKQLTGVAEPFADRRSQVNAVGVQIAGRIAEELATVADPAARFRRAALWSLAANSLDSRTAGTGYGFDPAGAYDYLLRYYQRDPAVDQIDRLYSRLGPGIRVTFIHDNVGEIALDCLLIDEIRRAGSYVTSAVRGGPITSDATWADAAAVGLKRHADRVILAGPDTLGISFPEMSPDLRQELGASDIVLAKGQANYYVLSEEWRQVRGGIFGLFTIKCAAVAGACGAERQSAMATFLPLGAAT